MLTKHHLLFKILILLTTLFPLKIYSFDYFDQQTKGERGEVISTQKQQQQQQKDLLLKQNNNNNSFNGTNFQIASTNNFGGNLNNLENVNIEIQLRGYSNPGFRLPQGRLCTCPKGTIGEHCIQASPQRNGYNCLISLSIFVISGSSSLKYFQTPYNPLNQAGQLNIDQIVSTQKFALESQPTAVAVLVYNLGPQINLDGSLYETNSVTLIDNFIQPLNNLISSSDFSSSFFGQQQQQNNNNIINLNGQILGTQLTLSYSISCGSGTSKDGKRLIGPSCDLNCNTSITQNTAICENVKTGYFSQCKWIAGNTQVSNCQNCPYGVKDGSYCADEQGGVLYGEVVSPFYYTAFIVLCCVSGILLVLLLLTCLLYLGRSFRKDNNTQLKPRASSKRSNDSALLSSTYNPPRIHKSGPEAAPLTSAAPFPPEVEEKLSKKFPHNKNEINNNNRGPSPFPRSNASTISIPSDIPSGQQQQIRFPSIVHQSGQQNGKMRKTLSPPRFQPLPHLGPQPDNNDLMNSSFASSSCRTAISASAAPSVSADV